MAVFRTLESLACSLSRLLAPWASVAPCRADVCAPMAHRPGLPRARAAPGAAAPAGASPATDLRSGGRDVIITAVTIIPHAGVAAALGALTSRWGVAATLVMAAVLLPVAQTFDTVIANGRVLDPESNLGAVRSLGITGQTISAISPGRLTGRTTIDATGAIVVPGFVDLHAHGRAADVCPLRAADGVTTALELEAGTGDVDAW